MRSVASIALVTALSLVPLAACRGTRPPQASTPAPQASAPAAAANAFTGTVAETMNSGGYTYARLQGGQDDVWIAASEFQTQRGDRLTVALDMPMRDFESKTLGRTFPLVYFVSRVTRNGEPVGGAAAPGAQPALMSSHASGPVATTVEPVDPAPGGMRIADVWAKRTSLAGQQVTVRGKVVKVNEQIMGRNWVHLQDGSGSAADQTNDLTITTADGAKLGDVITVSGVLAVEKDFGAGYKYGAIVENARVSR